MVMLHYTYLRALLRQHKDEKGLPTAESELCLFKDNFETSLCGQLLKRLKREKEERLLSDYSEELIIQLNHVIFLSELYKQISERLVLYTLV